MASKYRIAFTPDEDGWWTVTVPAVKGALTQARSVDQGLTRIREALALFVDDAAEAELVPVVRVEAAERAAIAKAKRLQKKAEQAQKEAAKASRELVHRLRARLSTRDVAHLLGLSPGRVGQLEHD